MRTCEWLTQLGDLVEGRLRYYRDLSIIDAAWAYSVRLAELNPTFTGASERMATALPILRMLDDGELDGPELATALYLAAAIAADLYGGYSPSWEEERRAYLRSYAEIWAHSAAKRIFRDTA